MHNKVISNHLVNGYSDFVLSYLLEHKKELKINQNILDVGTGNHRNLKLFQELGFTNLHGIDRNTSNNPLNVKLDFIQGDIQEGLPFPSQTFDIVLCNYVLMFIKNSKMSFVLDELMRVTKGYLLIETYPHRTGSGLFYEDYDFKNIAKYIKEKEDFEVLKNRTYYEKLLVRRKNYGER